MEGEKPAMLRAALQEVSAVTSWAQPHRGILGRSTGHASKLSLSKGEEAGPCTHQPLPKVYCRRMDGSSLGSFLCAQGSESHRKSSGKVARLALGGCQITILRNGTPGGLQQDSQPLWPKYQTMS